MDAGRNVWLKKKALDIAVGVETGVIGGVAMLALLMLIAPLLGQSWWTYPNLFASHYYSRAVVGYAPGLVTVSGIALQVFWAGIVGGLAGFLSPRGRAAMILAMFWFLGCYFVIWRKYAPGISLSGSAALLFASFLLYGSVLRLQPRFLARVRPASPATFIAASADNGSPATAPVSEVESISPDAPPLPPEPDSGPRD